MYRKSGQRALTAQEILDEAERLLGACEHVIPDRPGPQFIPGEAETFADMRKKHEAASSIQEAYGSKGKTRKLRADAASLYASVFSLPVRTEDALANETVKAESLNVLDQALEFERKRINAAGGQVLAGVIHWDEEHLHLHVVAVDMKLGRVDHLHPGRVAKKTVNDGPLPKGPERSKLANRAYRDAMVAWQDEVHAEVFGPAGLLRLGPGRSRYSRAEYRRAKTAQEELAAIETHANDYASWDAAQEQRQERLDAQEAVLRKKAADVEAREAAAAEADKRRAEADAMRRALLVGSQAVETRKIDYREPTEESEEGLEFGPAAPESKKERRSLMDIVRPAYSYLTKLAKMAFNLRRQQEDVERKAAENRQAAAAVAKAWRDEGRSPPKTIESLLNGTPLPLTRQAFPDALFIEKGADAKSLQRQLDNLSNGSLRKMWMATWRSQRLCDDQPELSADLDRGVDVLEFAAGQRGFDLETGKHDPDKAKDPHRARLHLDMEPEPMRVFKASRQRVRVRT